MLGVFDSPETKLAKANKALVIKYDKQSNTIVNSIDLIADKEYIEYLQDQYKVSKECKEYNINRKGTLKPAKQCSDFDVEDHNHDIKITVTTKKNKHWQVLASEEMNLPWCRRTQWEHNHINPFDPKRPVTWMYATDIACTPWQSFKVYATKHHKEYTVFHNGYLKWWTGNTIILKSWNMYYLFWHTKSQLKKWDTVKDWDHIWNTDWSWVVKWIHLHFEVWKDKQNISRTWNKVNPNSLQLYNIRFPKPKEISLRQSIDQYLISKWRQSYVDKKYFERVSKKWKVREEVLVCIWWIETHLLDPNYTKTPFNIWNIGNTDSWKTITYWSIIQWVDRMWWNLAHGKYLWGNMTVWDLSTDGWGNKLKYASDPNHINNFKDCLTNITGKNIPDTYNLKF